MQDHAATSSAPDYATQSGRFAYELRIANCSLESGDPSVAIALASTWEASAGVEAAEVLGRAAAKAGDDARARDALERLAELRGTRASVFAHSPELLRYAGQEWFVKAALRAWWRDRTPVLRPYVARVAGVRVGEIVSLSVASADAGIAPGTWGIWSGIVRESRIDRARGVTTLDAEGIDTYEMRVDEQVTVAAGGDRRKLTIQGRAGEKFEPNGRNFVVEIDDVRPSLAELRTFIAVGKLSSTKGADGRPVLEGFLVVDRQPKGGSQ